MNEKDKPDKTDKNSKPDPYFTEKNAIKIGRPIIPVGTVCVGNVCRVVPIMPKQVKPDVEKRADEDES